MLDKLKDPMFPWQKIEESVEGERVWQKHGGIITTGRISKNTPDGFMPSCFMRFDTPEKLAAALRIAVEEIWNCDYDHIEDAKIVLKQIEEALK